MPTFSRKELRVLWIIGILALVAGLLMAIIGHLGLTRPFGIPEYMTSLRNAGITLSVLAVLWNALTFYRKQNPA